jgi:chromosome segregation ATPase
MSEKAKRATPNGPASGKAASGGDGKKFAVGLQKIVADLETLCKGNEGVQDYGNLLASQVAARQEAEKWQRKASELQKEVKDLRDKQKDDLQQLQREINGLKQQKDNMMADYGEKYKDWDMDKRSHTDDLEYLARLREELETATAVVRNLEAENEDLHEQRRKLAEKFNDYEGKVAALKEQCEIQKLKIKQTTRHRDEYRKKAKDAEEQLGILPLETEKR